MELKRFLAGLRSQWLLIVLAVAVCVGATAAVVWSQTPSYTARTQFFVSTPTAPGNLSLTYQGGLFSQQRVLSYAHIVNSPEVAQRVIDTLDLPMTVEQLQRAVRASVPVDTILIDVTVDDSSAARAALIANAIGVRFPEYVNALETKGQNEAPVKVAVTSPAETPLAPSSPRKKLDLAIAAVLGLALGVGIATVRSRFDTRIRSAAEASELTGAPVLGSVPKHRGRGHDRALAALEISSTASEAYRRLRTNLRVHALTPPGHKTFMVTSAVESEGKTLIVANLGITFAQAGYRVVLVDGNLRDPGLARVLGLSPQTGLTNVIMSDMPLDDALQTWGENLSLSVLGCGRQPDKPSEILGSREFESLLRELEGRFDVVIVDSPAVMPVTDAAILAQVTSRVVLVTRANSTRSDLLSAAIEDLRVVDAQIVGVVLNRSREGTLSSSSHSETSVPTTNRLSHAHGLALDPPRVERS